MLVKNSFEYDARVRKEAASLVRAGHQVTVVALHLPKVTARSERHVDGFTVVRVPRVYGKLGHLVRASTTTPGAGSTKRSRPPKRHRRAATTSFSLLLRPAAFGVRALNAVVVNRRMTAAAIATRPRVLHAHDLNTLHPAALAARRVGARLVYDAHELASQRNGHGPVRRAWARAHERRELPGVDAMITATDAWADYLVGLHRITRPTVIRNVPELQVPSTRADRDLRARLGIPATHRVLLYQGSIQRDRGIEQVIDALAMLEACTLVVVGYGAHRPALERSVADRGLADCVRFFGPVPNAELVDWTASADVGLCTIRNSSLSYYWSLPNKLFEYLMAGIPVVASDFPEMGRIVRQEDVGAVCDPDKPESIAAAVRSALAGLPQVRERALAAASRHHWGREQERLVALYRDLEKAESAARKTGS